LLINAKIIENFQITGNIHGLKIYLAISVQQIYIETFSTGTSFSLSPNPHYETFRSSLEITLLQPPALCWPFPLSQELCWIHSSQQASLQPLPLRMTYHWWIWLCPWSLSNLVRL